MFVIITYDVGEKRVNRVRKILKKIFNLDPKFSF